MKSERLHRYSQLIKTRAREFGFEFCGISRAEKLDEEEAKLEDWLKKGHHGRMQYMENHFDKRLDPSLLVPDAKSVVSLLYNYFPEDPEEQTKYKVSKYAFGKDYHFVIKDKLKELLQALTIEIGEINGRIFVDSAPVMERQWAAKSGLGWIGKNTLLINKKSGSFFFLAEMIIDLELECDQPIGEYCGTCTRCIDACPTEAFEKSGVLNANKCISYLTIELKDEIPKEFHGKYNDWVFGCDICQDVCPWNRFSKPHNEPEFHKSEGVKMLEKDGLKEVTEDVFGVLFKNSPIKRTKYKGMVNNMTPLKLPSPDQRDL